MTNRLTNMWTNMMTYICLVMMVFALAGCNTTPERVVTVYKHMVVHPDEAMFNCPVLKEFPNWRTLKDSEVARTVVILHKNNLTCKSSIESIRTFLQKAEKKGS